MIIVIITVLVTTAVFFGIRYFVRARLRYGSAQTVICPRPAPSSRSVKIVFFKLTEVLRLR